jgi:hypothetical protein
MINGPTKYLETLAMCGICFLKTRQDPCSLGTFANLMKPKWDPKSFMFHQEMLLNPYHTFKHLSVTLHFVAFI